MYGVTCDLFPSSGDPSTLYRIDRATGAATKIFDLVGSTSLMGLAFGRNGKLYATDWYSNNSALYSVDMKTGFLTAIATIGYGFLAVSSWRQPPIESERGSRFVGDHGGRPQSSASLVHYRYARLAGGMKI